MSTVQIHMFGKFEIISNDLPVNCFHCQKALEVFCFLLLNRQRPHHREQLAEVFWGEHSTTDSKKYLRKALWQIQSELEQHLDPANSGLIQVEQNWIQFTGENIVWIDALVFEHSFQEIGGRQGEELDEQGFKIAQEAEELYRGDLLEGWYQDWCIFERERLKDVYIALVDRLMAYCEIRSDFENGIYYGRKLLALDRARESTYQRLIRLHLNNGDRISALRKFEACREALQKELDLEPSKATLDLYQQIKNDSKTVASISEISLPRPLLPTNSEILETLLQIRKAINAQEAEQRKILAEIKAIEQALLRH
jgi:DNA-binding SARP family transcriptional activator